MYNTVSLANSDCVNKEEILKKYSLSINEFNHEKALKEAGIEYKMLPIVPHKQVSTPY